MNKHRNVSLSFLLLGLITPWIFGCETMMVGVCRATAPYCAELYAEKQPSEVVLGRNKGSTIWHMQARTLQNGKWQWAQFSNGYCFVSNKQEAEFDADTVRHLNVIQALKYLEIFFPNLEKGGEGVSNSLTALPAGPL